MQKIKALQALRAIHYRGVLHNDIREENILLEDNGSDVYLIDFGMTSRLGKEEVVRRRGA
jgi:serine/threonine protein kinase